jgi:hypothetical protein
MLGYQIILLSCATGGAVVAYGAHRVSGRRSETVELLNEICEERESLRRLMAALPEQLELAKRSKLAAAETTGRLTSEATGRWLSELEADMADAKGLESQLPPTEVDRADQSGMELDLRLAEILALSIRVNRLADKYTLSSHADDASLEFDQPESLPVPPRALQPSLSAIAP